MFGLKKSKIGGLNYTLFNIPNVRNVKVAVHDDGNYITLVGRDKDKNRCNHWFRLGDREDLKPKKLKDFGLTSCRGTDRNEQEIFVQRVVNTFKK